MTRLVSLVLGFAALGCTNTFSLSGASAAIPQIRVRAESDLDCPQADIKIEEELGGRFHVAGCGQKALYKAQCDGLNCVIRGEGEGPVPFRDRPDPGSPLLP